MKSFITRLALASLLTLAISPSFATGTENCVCTCTPTYDPSSGQNKCKCESPMSGKKGTFSGTCKKKLGDSGSDSIYFSLQCANGGTAKGGTGGDDVYTVDNPNDPTKSVITCDPSYDSGAIKDKHFRIKCHNIDRLFGHTAHVLTIQCTFPNNSSGSNNNQTNN